MSAFGEALAALDRIRANSAPDDEETTVAKPKITFEADEAIRRLGELQRKLERLRHAVVDVLEVVTKLPGLEDARAWGIAGGGRCRVCGDVVTLRRNDQLADHDDFEGAHCPGSGTDDHEPPNLTFRRDPDCGSTGGE